MPDRLSYAMIQELFAAITRSLGSLGGVRTSDVDGSMILRRSFTMVLLADPCSPWRIKIGNGPVGRQAATSQLAHRIQLLSSPTLIKLRSSVRQPPRIGSGRGFIPLARRKETGGSAITCQPSGRISTTRHLASH